VYDGDALSPYRFAWLDLSTAADEALSFARAEPASARQLLGPLTLGSRRREVWEREIAFLRDSGVPADFLPGTDEVDRLLGAGSGISLPSA
jgi:hypothetical protein